MCWWNFVHDLASCIDTNVQCQFSHSKTALISVPQIINFALDLWRFQTHHFFPSKLWGFSHIFSPTTFMSTPRWHQESICRPGSKVKDCDPAMEQLTEITARQAWPSAGDEAFQCYGWNEDNEGVGWGCWVFCVSILIGGLVWSSLYTCELCTVKEYVSALKIAWTENVQGPPWHFWYLNLLDCNKTMCSYKKNHSTSPLHWCRAPCFWSGWDSTAWACTLVSLGWTYWSVITISSRFFDGRCDLYWFILIYIDLFNVIICNYIEWCLWPSVTCWSRPILKRECG